MTPEQAARLARKHNELTQAISRRIEAEAEAEPCWLRLGVFWISRGSAADLQAADLEAWYRLPAPEIAQPMQPRPDAACSGDVNSAE